MVFMVKMIFFSSLTFERRNITFSYLLCFVDRASLYNFVNKAKLMHNLFLVYLQIFTCFGRLWAQHKEKQVSGYAGCIPDGHPHRMTSTKCHINTVVSPDDGHVVARNMYRLIKVLRVNILSINCAPSWLYLQDYAGMHGQQNVKFDTTPLCNQFPTFRWYIVEDDSYRA